MVSTCHAAMNHLKWIDLLVVSLVSESAFSILLLFPLVLGNTMKQTIKKTSLKWCGFHLHVCSVGAHACMPIFAKTKGKNSLSRSSPSVSGTDCPATRSLRIPENHKKETKRKETFHMIFFWESDAGRQTPAACGVKPVFGGEIWGKRECSGIRVCSCVSV